MNVNLTDYAENDALEHGWTLTHWWVGWIGERIFVIPLGDKGIHRHRCPCNPQIEILNEKAMIVHNAFDGRDTL